ncbi:MAG TPA: response regulator [Candidatus Paceibacterota bacterium]|nr:response regulator [Candidatus Paceibacterota bacterium]
MEIEKEEEKKIVLIIEDEVPILEALVDKLEREGFKTLQAKDGKEGIALADAHHPDMIILDVLMPVMDGIAFMKQIREEKNSWGKKVPIMVLTNLGGEQKSQLDKYKPAFYITKTSLSMNDVANKIKAKIS